MDYAVVRIVEMKNGVPVKIKVFDKIYTIESVVKEEGHEK